MVNSGNWLVTTFHDSVDYYNSKPPLNVWLIAASFKMLGISLWSMRLPSFHRRHDHGRVAASGGGAAASMR